MSYPLGVVFIVYGRSDMRRCFSRAAADGFDHVDVPEDWLVDELGLTGAAGSPAPPLPPGDVLSWDVDQPGYTSSPRAFDADASYDEIVTHLRGIPGIRLEVVPLPLVGSIEAVRRLAADVPDLRFTIDTGHIAAWGEDPVDLLDLADHVQLRQAAKGRPQLHPDEGGDVDFAAVINRLDALDYRGLLSVEYFDLPELGWPLDNPQEMAVDLARRVRPLLTRL